MLPTGRISAGLMRRRPVLIMFLSMAGWRLRTAICWTAGPVKLLDVRNLYMIIKFSALARLYFMFDDSQNGKWQRRTSKTEAERVNEYDR